MSYNSVTLIGNLTRDPELKYLPSGTALAEVSIAVNEVYKDKNGNKKEEVFFFDLTFWGRTAELLNQYYSKGRAVMVVGRLKQDRWEDKQSGQKRSKVYVNVEQLVFLPRSDGAGGGGGGRDSELSGADEPPAGQLSSQTDQDVPF